MQTKIAADPLLIAQHRVPDSAIPIDQLSSLDNIDYILTTYHPTYREDGYTIAETVVDASGGTVENNALKWWLILPTVSEENPLYLKGVDVTYNQPVQ